MSVDKSSVIVIVIVNSRMNYSYYIWGRCTLNKIKRPWSEQACRSSKPRECYTKSPVMVLLVVVGPNKEKRKINSIAIKV